MLIISHFRGTGARRGGKWGGSRWSAGAHVFSVFPPCREWVLKSSILIAMAVYTYLRLIVDHHGTAQLQALRQKEVDFCISLLRERVRTKNP